ncbi:MAG: thiamine diphosphokinase [Candidatus Fimivivens sp.]|nr:thiamine diphosphokinase [Candidatus Fimivivens sp.]
MARRCVVFCAGEEGEIDFAVTPEDFVICCDAGYLAAERRGISPDLLIGDFDSYREPLPESVETLHFPVEKDDTDSMLALREGLRRGYKEFVLLFALGGRLDHTLANLQALAFLEEFGASGMIIGPRDRVQLLKNGALDIPRRSAYTFSIFAYSGKAIGVTLKGMQYPLNDAVVTETFPIGLGNHIIEPVGRVSVLDGMLLVVESKIN